MDSILNRPPRLMHVQYEMIPCSGFIEEVLSVDADAGRIVLAYVTLLLLGGWLKINIWINSTTHLLTNKFVLTK